jgi:hypothetical protein
MQISTFVKILSVWAELFRADEQTDGQGDRRRDMTKLIVAFRKFANAPKNCKDFLLLISINRNEEVNQSSAIHYMYLSIKI